MTEQPPPLLAGQLELEAAIAIRQRFSACCRDMSERKLDSDNIATAFAEHLGDVTAGQLPPTAQFVWLERIVRPLKANPTKPLPQRTIGGIRSWPSARITELVAAIEDIERILIDAENDARNEIIYAEISRAYS